MAKTFEDYEIGDHYVEDGYVYFKASHHKSDSKRNVLLTMKYQAALKLKLQTPQPIGIEEKSKVEDAPMEQYFRDLAKRGKADLYSSGIHIFTIGQGDVEFYPELLQIYQVWVFDSSGTVQTIHLDSVAQSNKSHQPLFTLPGVY